jgi:hypothetical protein
MIDVSVGDLLWVRTADGKMLERRAASGVTDGEDFPVVWVCRLEAWDPMQPEACKARAVPWPADAVERAA